MCMQFSICSTIAHISAHFTYPRWYHSPHIGSITITSSLSLTLTHTKWCFRPRFCTASLYCRTGRMRWILLWIMPVVQDRTLDLLISSPVRYHCAMDAPMQVYLIFSPITRYRIWAMKWRWRCESTICCWKIATKCRMFWWVFLHSFF